jgi:putative salt-induced outer membrane protein YdiY
MLGSLKIGPELRRFLGGVCCQRCEMKEWIYLTRSDCGCKTNANFSNPNPNQMRPKAIPTSSSLSKFTGSLLTICTAVTVALGGEVSPKTTKAVAPPAPASPWEVTAATGVGFATGNTDNLNLSAQLLASYFKGPHELYLGADYFYAENLGVQTTNNLRIYGTYNRLVTDLFYLGSAVDFFTDEPAALDYRLTAIPHLGYFFVKNDQVKLSVEAGLGYLWEDQGGRDDYLVWRLSQRLEMRLSDRVTLWESVSLVPRASDFSNSYVVAEAGVRTRLSDRWAFRTFVRNIYDSTPASGEVENDLSLIAGVSYALGGLPAEEAAPLRRSLKPAMAAPAPPALGWTRTAGLGFALSQGNSEALLASANVLADYRGKSNEVFLSAIGAYGENDGVETVKNVRLGTQYNRLLSDHWFVGLEGRFAHDAVALVDYRVMSRAALGCYLVRNDAIQLSFEAGPGYLWEEVGGIQSDYMTVEAVQKLNWKLSDTVSIGENIGWVGSTEDSEDYLIQATAFVDVAVSDRLSFRTTVTNTFDNTPAAGSERNDLILTAGVAVKF